MKVKDFIDSIKDRFYRKPSNIAHGILNEAHETPYLGQLKKNQIYYESSYNLKSRLQVSIFFCLIFYLALI